MVMRLYSKESVILFVSSTLDYTIIRRLAAVPPVHHCAFLLLSIQKVASHSELHYSFGFEYMITSFSDINLISVLPGTNTVLVGRKHGQFELRINGAVNCKEFVAAVKAEMAHSQQ